MKTWLFSSSCEISTSAYLKCKKITQQHLMFFFFLVVFMIMPYQFSLITCLQHLISVSSALSFRFYPPHFSLLANKFQLIISTFFSSESSCYVFIPPFLYFHPNFPSLQVFICLQFCWYLITQNTSYVHHSHRRLCFCKRLYMLLDSCMLAVSLLHIIHIGLLGWLLLFGRNTPAT